MAERWVLDTSVAAGWFFEDEPLRADALAVRRTIADEPNRFVVPALFHSELLHVLARKSGRDAAFVDRAFLLTLRLGLRVMSLTEDGWRAASRWTIRGLSGYDATFVALAEETRARWLTGDDRAIKSVGSAASEPLRGFARRH